MKKTVYLAATFAAAIALTSLMGFVGYEQDRCGAKKYSALVGSPIDMVRGKLPNGKRIRIEEPGMGYSMEFKPDRLRVILNRQREINRVICG